MNLRQGLIAIGVTLGSLVWALIDEKSFNAYWWLILPVTIGVALYDAMLKEKTEG